MQILATMPLHNGVICVNWLTIESEDPFAGNGHFSWFKLKYWLLYRSVYTSFDKRQRYIFPKTRETQIWAQSKVKNHQPCLFIPWHPYTNFEIKYTDYIQKRKEANFWNDYIVDIAGLFCPESKHVLFFIFHQNQRYMFQSIFSLERQTSCNSLLLFVMINKWGDMCHFQFQSLWRGGALHQVFLTHKGFRLPHLAGSASPSQGPHTCAMLHYWPI